MKAFPFRRVLLAVSFCLLLTHTISACSTGGTPPPNQTQSTPTTTTDVTPPSVTQTPVVLLGERPCPDIIKAPSHWDTIVNADAADQGKEQVSCGNLTGNPSLQALITVPVASSATLNVYVYTNIINNAPNQLFKLEGLVNGSAKISGYNTVLTGEAAPNSSINKGKSASQFTADFFREFKWSDSAGTLVQIGFSGIYPDLTRFQAETDQAKVNQGQDIWKISATQVSSHLATDLLKWPSTATTTVVSGGGSNDTDAIVTVAAGNAGQQIQVTLSRLEGNTNGGIWEAISVQLAATAAVTAPQALARITSPVTVTGNHMGFEGVIGKVSILDHLYTDIGHTTVQGSTATFTVNLTYTSTVNSGNSEEGIIVFYPDNAIGGPQRAEMIKVLISA